MVHLKVFKVILSVGCKAIVGTLYLLDVSSRWGCMFRGETTCLLLGRGSSKTWDLRVFLQ